LLREEPRAANDLPRPGLHDRRAERYAAERLLHRPDLPRSGNGRKRRASAVERPGGAELRRGNHQRSVREPAVAIVGSLPHLGRARGFLRPPAAPRRLRARRYPPHARERGRARSLRPLRYTGAGGRRVTVRATALRLAQGVRPHLDPALHRAAFRSPGAHPARRERRPDAEALQLQGRDLRAARAAPGGDRSEPAGTVRERAPAEPVAHARSTRGDGRLSGGRRKPTRTYSALIRPSARRLQKRETQPPARLPPVPVRWCRAAAPPARVRRLRRRARG